MIKKILLILLVLLVIAGAGFWFMSYSSEQSLSTFANSINQDPNYASRTIPMEEVKLHASKSDCWLVIDNDVLNVTAFVDKHPGGEAILAGCGADASDYFHGVSEHVRPLVKMLYQKMIIGKLAKS
jgi:cytochrome b involved in lipid metabolism